MKQRTVAVLILLLTFVLVYAIFLFSDHDTVTGVLDVDHLQLKGGRTVYLLGIEGTGIEVDTLETGADTTGAVPTGRMTPAERERAHALVDTLSHLVEGQEVELDFTHHFEPDSASVDLHAYVHLKDGTDVGAWLLENGYAAVDTTQTHPKKKSYLEMEKKAQEAQLGIWAASPDTTIQVQSLGNE